MADKKANHQANIVCIDTILPHTNADTLEIIPIGEYQVVSKKGQFKVGDFGVYIQPDSIIPQTQPFKFIWQPYLDDRLNDPILHCELVNPYRVPEKRRRVTVRKFRGEWSEGLLLPVTDFPELNTWSHDSYGTVAQVGDDVSDALNITHYDPDAGKTEGENGAAPKRKVKRPKGIRGWYYFIWRKVKNLLGLGNGGAESGVQDTISLGIPTYDVDNFKNYKNTFVEGEKVRITEKIHGSNARFLFLDGVMYAGSRNLWKSPSSNCIFRKALKELPWIEEWCREYEGHVLWGEIGPSQKGFDYGVEIGKLFFYVFDVLDTNGKWVEDDNELWTHLQAFSVPTLYKGPFSEELLHKYTSGPSTLGKHIREGIVVRAIPERHVQGLGRAQLKVVSNDFLLKDNK